MQGSQNRSTKNTLRLTNAKVSMMMLAEWAKTSLSQERLLHMVANLFRHYNYSHFIAHPIMGCPFPPATFLGHTSLLLPRAPRTLVTPLTNSSGWNRTAAYDSALHNYNRPTDAHNIQQTKRTETSVKYRCPSADRRHCEISRTRGAPPRDF